MNRDIHFQMHVAHPPQVFKQMSHSKVAVCEPPCCTIQHLHATCRMVWAMLAQNAHQAFLPSP